MASAGHPTRARVPARAAEIGHEEMGVALRAGAATIAVIAAALAGCPDTTAGATEATFVFRDVTASAGLLSPLTGMKGHAAAWGDVDGDGRPDLFVDTFADRAVSQYTVRGATGPSPDRLLRNLPGGFAPVATFPRMLGRTSGAAFADLDCDGDLDLVLSRNYRPKARGTLGTQVLRNDGKAFRLVTRSGLPTDFGGRSIGVLDYDGDGRLDILAVEWDPALPSLLLHNETPAGNWLQVSVRAPCRGIGALVAIYEPGEAGNPQALIAAREITATTGYTVGVAPCVHVGLGDRTTVDVVVRPVGQRPIILPGVAANQHLGV